MKNFKILMIGSDTNAFLRKDNLLIRRLIEYSKYSKIYYVNFAPRLKLNNYKKENLNIYFVNENNFILNTIKFIALCSNLIKKERINIISVQDPFFGFLCVFLKLVFRIPLNIQLHMDIIDNPYWLQESIKYRILNIIGKISLKFSNTIRVVSENIKRKLQEKLRISNKKIFTCPVYVEDFNYLDLNVNQNIERKYEDKTIILSVGRLIKTKNFRMLIKVAKKICKENKQVIFLIAGDGPEKESLNRLIKKNNLSENFKILGWINRKELVSYYKLSKFFVLTSNHEGFPRVCLEALYCGIPVISTNTGAVNEILYDHFNGLIIPINDPNKLEAAIRLLLRDDELYNKLKVNAKKIDLNLYSKENIVKRLTKIFRKTFFKDKGTEILSN